jgi:glycerophosphoryl diester phosphodiesterase
VHPLRVPSPRGRRSAVALLAIATGLLVSTAVPPPPADASGARPSVPDHGVPGGPGGGGDDARGGGRWPHGGGSLGSRARRAVYAHRGASGYRPEHTEGAYELAIAQGADVIEPDLVLTKDGVLVDRHENEISGTTDVASRPQFAARRTTKTIDGVPVTGWFTEDFTLAELRTLRAKERLPELRPANVAFDGRWRVPTLQEVVDLARRASARTGRTIALAPEIKHSTYFHGIGQDPERALVRLLRRNGLDHRRAPVIVQSFEVGNLRWLHRHSRVRTVQLLDAAGGPFDAPERTYAQLATPAGLREIARYADAVSPNTGLVVPRDAAGRSQAPTSFVRDAHRAGLPVVVWTFRRENAFLPLERRAGTDPATPGDLAGYLRQVLDLGVDALFTDNPDIGVAAVRAFEEEHRGRGPADGRPGRGTGDERPGRGTR